MSQLYDRVEIYDLIENEKRTELIRRDWKQFLGDREIHSLLDVSIGTGGMTLPLQELDIENIENVDWHLRLLSWRLRLQKPAAFAKKKRNEYCSSGFIENGEMDDDEIVAVLKL